MASFDEFHDLVQKENAETIAKFYEQFLLIKLLPYVPLSNSNDIANHMITEGSSTLHIKLFFDSARSIQVRTTL